MKMINTNRRKMLLGLAAASTAAATGTTGKSAPQEADELLTLADGLGETLEAYKRADERVHQIVREWAPHWPAPDMRIVRYGADCKAHRDILGRGVETEWAKGIMRVQDLGTPEHFEESARQEWALYDHKMQTKSKRGAKTAKSFAERDAALIEPARSYWSQVERITEASGIEAAKVARSEALEALRKLVGQIVLFREKTVTGLIIKAQAMQAWESIEPFYRSVNLDGQAWAEAMTATVLRQAA
jgi:hypothetical protein